MREDGGLWQWPMSLSNCMIAREEKRQQRTEWIHTVTPLCKLHVKIRVLMNCASAMCEEWKGFHTYPFWTKYRQRLFVLWTLLILLTVFYLLNQPQCWLFLSAIDSFMLTALLNFSTKCLNPFYTASLYTAFNSSLLCIVQVLFREVTQHLQTFLPSAGNLCNTFRWLHFLLTTT